MGKRGRPRYPDVLTPREWEVLSFLREGLTNEQIAERLGVTLHAARYHVSQILSKLGVATREEAAAWQPEEARAPPMVARLPDLAATGAASGCLGGRWAAPRPVTTRKRSSSTPQRRRSPETSFRQIPRADSSRSSAHHAAH